jgi:hypothetical protein
MAVVCIDTDGYNQSVQGNTGVAVTFRIKNEKNIISTDLTGILTTEMISNISFSSVVQNNGWDFQFSSVHYDTA